MHTRRTNRRQLLGLGAGFVLTGAALSGCTWLDARSSNRLTVNLLDQGEIDKPTLTIPTGSTVVWRNVGTDRRAITTDASLLDDPSLVAVPEGVEPWDSGDLTAGMTWEFTFDEPGTWMYVDRLGGGQAVGVIVVEE